MNYNVFTHEQLIYFHSTFYLWLFSNVGSFVLDNSVLAHC